MHRPHRRSAAVVLAGLALLTLVSAMGVLSPVAADPVPVPPPQPQPHVAAGSEPLIVMVGDESGGGGRWAGNENLAGVDSVDALGKSAYFDNAGHDAEVTPECWRATGAAPIHIRDTNTVNLACNGARTVTSWREWQGYGPQGSGYLVPGVDFYHDPASGEKGQALQLQEVATGKYVGLVVLSVGRNDFDVDGVAEWCRFDWLWSYYCNNKDHVRGFVSADRQKAIEDDIVASIGNIRTAMRNAGHADGEYALLVMTYPTAIPYSKYFRYGEDLTRTDTGGCPFYNADADWLVNDVYGVVDATVTRAANRALGPGHVIDTGQLLRLHHLCQYGVGLMEESGYTSWKGDGASDKLEWVNFYDTMDGHQYFEWLTPNYWGQLAMRNCVRQAWNDGAPRGGTCLGGSGLDDLGEPNVSFNGAVANHPPVGTADSYAVSGPVHVAGRGVLENDTDAGATVLPLAGLTPASQAATAGGPGTELPSGPDELTARLVAGPTHGTLDLLADGSFTYTPAPGFSGVDRFTYQPADFYEAGPEVTVDLNVTAVPPPPVAPANAVVASPAFTG